MQPPKDDLGYLRLMSNFQTTCFVVFAESLLAWYRGVSCSAKHMKIEAKIMFNSVLVPC